MIINMNKITSRRGHRQKWEKVTGKNVKKVTFRNKSNYLLQYYTEEDSCVYKKNMNEDIYFRAFIESLDYRENCYNCHYSREERETIKELLKVLGESGSLDELGVGIVRDSISDLLYPGTSFLHTRAKYYILFRSFLRKP